jgi:phosphatidylserine decarboxylase
MSEDPREPMPMRAAFTLPGVPRAAISRAAGFLAERRLPRSARRRVWPFLCRRLGIERAAVPGEWEDYASFLDLFTRPLPPQARPLPADDGGWLSPADGVIVDTQLLAGEGSWVIKGSPYAVHELLPGMPLARVRGWRATQIYLAPRDYHRFHAPCDLEVLSATTTPGGLQTVDPSLVRRSWRVLARNRRVLLRCRARGGEELALSFVGALNVGRMRFTMDPTLGAEPWVEHERKYDPPVRVARGAELGRFEFGSTVVLFGDAARPFLVAPGARCRAREPMMGPQPVA